MVCVHNCVAPEVQFTVTGPPLSDFRTFRKGIKKHFFHLGFEVHLGIVFSLYKCFMFYFCDDFIMLFINVHLCCVGLEVVECALWWKGEIAI